MLNIGPFEFLVIALIGLVVLGPDKLPGLAKDAGRLLRTLRDVATGARSSLREELGPEFADLDLRNLNPRTAVQRALLGDDVDLSKFTNPRSALQEFLLDADPDDDVEEVAAEADDPQPRVGLTKGGTADDEQVQHPPADGAAKPSTVIKPQAASGPSPQPTAPPSPRPRPRPRPTPATLPEPPPYDADAT